MGSASSLQKGTPHNVSGLCSRIYLRTLPTRLDRDIQHPAGFVYPSPSPHRSNMRYRNINLLSIDYAFRPRLRCRLTLRRLTWRRKPWAFGVEVFHPHYRYSCQHSHFRYLQHALRHTFAGVRNAPLPNVWRTTRSRSFGTQLEPR